MTVPLLSNIRCTQRFCSFILGPPTASAPSFWTPSSSSRLVVAGDALDADGLGGRVVDDHLHAVDLRPAAAAQDLYSRRACREHGHVAGQRGVELVA